MKPTDLRIGNLATDKEGNLLRVCGLNDDRVDFTVIDRSKFPLPKGWKAEPIPLTKLIFIEFGFKKIGVNYELEGFVIWTLRSGEFVFRGINDIIIKSVHQLQNLYYRIKQKELWTT